MGARGPAPIADFVKKQRGTLKPAKSRARVVPEIEGAPEQPEWLSVRAEAIWTKKIAVYKARKQSVRGMEAALAQYCELEAYLIHGWGTEAAELDVKALALYRQYARDFYDVPAAQLGAAGSGAGHAPEANPFTRAPRKRPA